jgi:hypothetical protein
MNAQWVIQIGGGYGAFMFEGTEAEAEQMRKHKANWEQAVGAKRLADQVERATGQPSGCWNHPNFKFKQRRACDCAECAGNSDER